MTDFKTATEELTEENCKAYWPHGEGLWPRGVVYPHQIGRMIPGYKFDSFLEEVRYYVDTVNWLWFEEDWHCTWCGSNLSEPHKPDCFLGDFLKRLALHG